jgi:hypothetical protein
MTSARRLKSPVWTLAFFVAVWLALAPIAQGQDIVGQDSRRVETNAGPYTVVVDVQTLPSLQSVQFFIRITETATGVPAEDLTVSVLTTWSESDEAGENIALSPNIPGLYTATLQFDPGRWETTILIEPPTGGSYGADGFAFDVPTPTTDSAAGFVFIGVAVVLIAGAGYLTWRIRQNQKARAVARGDAPQ